jgi:ectonucleotide pyrophosphatase/phosphodiesterase family member 5
MKKIILIILLIIFSDLHSQIPYTILISFDGFRWDYANRGITPNLDKLADVGVTASSLRPCFPTKTYPNHYSIISGCYIDKHGIIANNFTDPQTGEKYSLGDRASVQNEKWYKAKAFWEVAAQNGIISASYFYPGSELDDPERRPKYFEYYEHNRPSEDRIKGTIDWLQLPYTERPKFLTLYFHETDSYGHVYGPNSSEIDTAIARLDNLLGILFDDLKKINLYDSTNIIVVSDHGMTEISMGKIINIEEMLSGFSVAIQGEKPFMLIEPAEDELDSVYKILKKNSEHFKVYKKAEIPKYYHYKNSEAISSILLVADLGWSLVTKDWFKSLSKYASKGNHGYDNNCLDMHGIFYAAGPSFKQNHKTGTVWNIDIFPLLCEIFSINCPQNIDGNLERIGFILKEK